MRFLGGYTKLTHNANGDYNIGPTWGLPRGYLGLIHNSYVDLM